MKDVERGTGRGGGEGEGGCTTYLSCVCMACCKDKICFDGISSFIVATEQNLKMLN